MIYEKGTLSKILTENGYVSFSGTTLAYHYYLADHLGNNRVVMNAAGSVEQVNHYYPFGGIIAESSGQEIQPWKYGGKELDRNNNLNWSDFGARMYDPLLAIFCTLDPKADKYCSVSPYRYCANNPLKYIDPTGEWIESAWDIFSLATGIKSFVNNVKQGNAGAAIIDGVGIVADAAAVILPGVPGGVGVTIKGTRAVDKVVDAAQTAKIVDKTVDGAKAVEKTAETSRAARREVMRNEGIPTSQQPKSQSKNASGREYSYDVPKDGGGIQTKSVQQQTKDRSHKDRPHWEAGKTKTDDRGNTRTNPYGRPKLDNDKSKVYY